MWYLKKIPKVVHFYWGSHMLSYLRYLTLVTFRKQNPDWLIKFYYPKQTYAGGPVWNQGYAEEVKGIDYRDRIKEIPYVEMIELDFDALGIGYVPDVFRSDIWRLKLLATEGGLYSDMDILYFKPMQSALFNLPRSEEIDTVISYNAPKRHYSIGFLMAAPGNEFYDALYKASLKKMQREGEYQHIGVALWHAYAPNPDAIEAKHLKLKLYDIEMWLVYSINSFQITQIIDKNVELSDKETIGLHWYGGHPRCIHWENLITENNLNEFNNTLVSTVRRALV